MTVEQVNARLRVCQSCPRYHDPCPQGQKLADSEAVCPLDPPAWARPGALASLVRGQIGDAVAVVAKPIARKIDGIAGTDIEHCIPCGQRQQDWNLKRRK